MRAIASVSCDQVHDGLHGRCESGPSPFSPRFIRIHSVLQDSFFNVCLRSERELVEEACVTTHDPLIGDILWEMLWEIWEPLSP